MAAVIESLPTHGNRLYPWREWTDGKPRRAWAGYDFACSPHSFVMQLRQRASVENKRVTVRRGRMGDVCFQFVGAE